MNFCGKCLWMYWSLACGHTASHTLFWMATVCWAWIFLPELTNYMSGEKSTLVALTGREWSSELAELCWKRKESGKQREYRPCVAHRWMRPQFGCHGSKPEFCDWHYTLTFNKMKQLLDFFLYIYIFIIWMIKIGVRSSLFKLAQSKLYGLKCL